MIDEDYDAVIVADYDKGFLSEDDLELLSQIAPYTFIDTKKRFGDWILGYTYIKINEKEWDENSDWEKIDQVHDRCIVTLGSKGSRLNVTADSSPNLSGRIGSNTFQAVDAYLKIAKTYNLDPTHMALSFCASRPFMGSVIFGATNNDQLTHILGGLNLILPDEVLTALNKVNRQNPMPI